MVEIVAPHRFCYSLELSESEATERTDESKRLAFDSAGNPKEEPTREVALPGPLQFGFTQFSVRRRHDWRRLAP